MKWLVRFLVLVLALGVVAGGAWVAGTWSARSTPVVRHVAIGLADWPKGAPPLKVALLSDIHMGGSAMDPARLDRIVSQVGAERPDLVLIAGDFVYGHEAGPGVRYAAELAGPLSRLKPPLGVAAVLGNHDQAGAPRAIMDALTRDGVEVVENRAVQRGPLALVGVGDSYSGHDRLQRALASAAGLHGPRLVLTHSPDLAWRLPRDGLPLLLAGHTHCSQVFLPVISDVYLRFHYGKSQRLFDPRYRCGLVRDPGRLVLVTAGLGASGPQVRLNSPPDWWLATLGPVRPGAITP